MCTVLPFFDEIDEHIWIVWSSNDFSIDEAIISVCWKNRSLFDHFAGDIKYANWPFKDQLYLQSREHSFTADSLIYISWSYLKSNNWIIYSRLRYSLGIAFFDYLLKLETKHVRVSNENCYWIGTFLWDISSCSSTLLIVTSDTYTLNSSVRKSASLSL